MACTDLNAIMIFIPKRLTILSGEFIIKKSRAFLSISI